MKPVWNHIKLFFKSSVVLFCYFLVFFFLFIFTLDKFLLHKNWVSMGEVMGMISILLMVIFFEKYHSKISELGFFKFYMKKAVQEGLDEYFALKIVSDKIKIMDQEANEKGTF